VPFGGIVPPSRVDLQKGGYQTCAEKGCVLVSALLSLLFCLFMV
jgi:hypothetical protein